MQLQLNNKRILVLGLGETGLSALRWLAPRGALLSVADTRPAPPQLEKLKAELPQVAMHLGPLQPELFEHADIVVASPGVPLSEPEVQAAIARGIPVVGDIELFAQHKPANTKVIAITGSNGKSTVTALVGEMCQRAGLKTIVAGNIGLPVLQAMDMDAPDVYVLELSSFQLETTHSLEADAATVLNVTEDHMDRYADMAEYAAAKARIFYGNGAQVLNREDVWSCRMGQDAERSVTFGTDAPPSSGNFGLLHQGERVWLAQGENPLLDVKEMQIAGLHNAANALAALALCRAIGLDYPPLLEALREFKALSHRVEWVAEIGGVAYYDDSKGTNVGATCAALAGMPRKVVLIAGGDGKGQDFTPLREPVLKNARAVVLIGRDAPLIAGVLQGVGVPLIDVASMGEAVKKAAAAAMPGDAVLLSPACASWDMFRNYAHRAEVFIAEVKSLEAGT